MSRMRFAVGIALTALLVAACGSDGGPPQVTAAGDTIPLPPIELGAAPALVGTATDLYAVAFESVVPGAISRYSFEDQEWHEVAAPPAFGFAKFAWSGDSLVIVGLDGCESVRCAGGDPKAALLGKGADSWRTVDLPLSEVDPEVFSLSTVGGRNGSATFMFGEGRVLEVGQDGTATVSEPVPGRIVWGACQLDGRVVALGRASTAPVAAPETAPSPSRTEVFEVPTKTKAASWRAANASRPPVVDSFGAGGTICAADGLVLTDGKRTLRWTPSGGWRAGALPTTGPRSPFSSHGLAPDADPIVFDGQAAHRLDLAEDGSPRSWKSAPYPTQSPSYPPVRQAATVAGGRAVVLEAPAEGNPTLTILEV